MNKKKKKVSTNTSSALDSLEKSIAAIFAPKNQVFVTCPKCHHQFTAQASATDFKEEA